MRQLHQLDPLCLAHILSCCDTERDIVHASCASKLFHVPQPGLPPRSILQMALSMFCRETVAETQLCTDGWAGPPLSMAERTTKLYDQLASSSFTTMLQLESSSEQRLVDGLKRIATVPQTAQPYMLAPGYRCPTTCTLVPGASGRASFWPSKANIMAAAALAESRYIVLEKRKRGARYSCSVPEELQAGADPSRARDGNLHRAWQMSADAAGYAQPALGPNGSVILDRRCAGMAKLEYDDVMGIFAADGCFSASFQGDFCVIPHLVIKMQCCRDAVQLLACVQACIGAGTVIIRASNHLGYYVEVSWECGGAGALAFFAHYWRRGGTKAKQLQLCHLGLALGTMPKRAEHRAAAIAARNVFVAALKCGKAPILDAGKAFLFYRSLFHAYSRAEFFSWVTFFFEGDGSCTWKKGCRHVSIAQSDLGFLQAISKTFEQYGMAEMSIHLSRLAGSEQTPTCHKKTRDAYIGRLHGSKAIPLAQEMYAVYAARGMADFRKAKVLKTIGAVSL